MWYFILGIALAIWVILDAKSRHANILAWSIGTVLLAPIVLPFYFASRPLKYGETREGGKGWNLMKNFSIVWTLLMAVAALWSLIAISQHAPTTTSEAEQTGFAIGATLGFGMIGAIWFFPVLGALVLGLLLKKSKLIETGPTGPLSASAVDNREASSTAPSAVSEKKKRSIITVFIIIALVLLLFYFGVSLIKDKPIEKGSHPVSQKMGYYLTPQESAILSFLLRDEASAIEDGRDSLFAEKLPKVSAMEAAKAYEDNQVAADQKYYQKRLRVTGKIEGINSGIGNEPYILLRGTNMFQSPQIHFDKPDVARISTVKKGQTLNVVCDGGGAIVGTPMFQNCLFADDYAGQKIETVKHRIGNFLAGKRQDEEIAYITIISMAVARSIPETAPCFSDPNACGKAVNSFMENGKDSKSHIIAVVEELRTGGVTIPDNITKTIISKTPNATSGIAE